MTRVSQQTQSMADNLDLPKFKMSNDAQVGGDKIATVVQVAMAGTGLVKGVTRASAVAAGQTHD